LKIADYQLPNADLQTFGDENWQLAIGNEPPFLAKAVAA